MSTDEMDDIEDSLDVTDPRARGGDLFEEHILPDHAPDELLAGSEPLNLSTAHSGGIGAANQSARARRRRLFNRKRERGFDGITIVSEGDSWWQYPVRLRDVIDHLREEDDFNILSLGAGGDWLANMWARKEYRVGIEAVHPQLFLLSGGGNDMVGKGRLRFTLKPYTPGRGADWYSDGEAAAVIDQLGGLYQRILTDLTTRYPQMKVVTHGYDYAIPDDGVWLGRPMKDLGIRDEQLQAQIIRVMIDRFNEVLSSVVSSFSQVSYVDCRGVVKKWHNELHPKSRGFGEVAQRIEDAARRSLSDG